MTTRRPAALLLATLGALLLVVLPTAPALAHTEQVGVSPAAGSTTAGTVPAVEIDFSDEVLPGLARVVVRDAGGRDHVAGRVAVLGGRVTARLENVRPGRYRVAYRVVADDGHPVTGQYRFRVAADGTASSTTVPAATSPTVDGAAAGRAAGTRAWGFPALLVGVLVLSGSARWRVAHRKVRS